MSLLTACLTSHQFCKHQELETLKDLYNQDDNHQELGSFHIRASYAEEVRGSQSGWGLWAGQLMWFLHQVSRPHIWYTPHLVLTVEEESEKTGGQDEGWSQRS